MTPEQIKRCAEGAPPPGEYSEALTFLATSHLKLVEALKSVTEGPIGYVSPSGKDKGMTYVLPADRAALQAVLRDLGEASS